MIEQNKRGKRKNKNEKQELKWNSSPSGFLGLGDFNFYIFKFIFIPSYQVHFYELVEKRYEDVNYVNNPFVIPPNF